MKTYFRVNFHFVSNQKPIIVSKSLDIKWVGETHLFAVNNTNLEDFQEYSKKVFPTIKTILEKQSKRKIDIQIKTISRSTYYRELNKCE